MTADAPRPRDLAPLGPPDTLDDEVGALARIGGSRSPSLSPDGARLAFVSDRGGIPQVWIVPTAGGEPTQITMLDDQVGMVA